MSIPVSHVYVGEAPESIDRSSNEAYQADRDEFNPGETLRFKRATFTDESPEVWTFRVAEDGRPHKVGPAIKIGRVTPSARWTPTEPGRWEVHTRPEKPDKPKSERPDTKITGYTVEPGDGNAGEETSGSADDWTNTEEPGPEIEPENYAGIVNADNEQGIALAPDLRRAGASLDENGATVNLPNGETVEVGAIEDSDEVARYIEGDRAGEVIDADQSALDDSDASTNSSDGLPSDLGSGATAVVVLALVYAARRYA